MPKRGRKRERKKNIPFDNVTNHMNKRSRRGKPVCESLYCSTLQPGQFSQQSFFNSLSRLSSAMIFFRVSFKILPQIQLWKAMNKERKTRSSTTSILLPPHFVFALFLFFFFWLSKLLSEAEMKANIDQNRYNKNQFLIMRGNQTPALAAPYFNAISACVSYSLRITTKQLANDWKRTSVIIISQNQFDVK